MFSLSQVLQPMRSRWLDGWETGRGVHNCRLELVSPDAGTEAQQTPYYYCMHGSKSVYGQDFPYIQ